MTQSLVYKNICIYRLLMNVLYLGKYKRRFERINSIINKNTKNVIEYCFGDIYIARFCKNRNIQWTGYDLNKNFVKYAKKHGYAAINEDITKFSNFPNCDTCIIIGSLYHFNNECFDLLQKMIKSSKQIIISEPIKNLSSSKGIIGYIAKRSANVGKGQEVFRFNEKSLIELIHKLNVKYKIISIDKDIIIEIINDRN